MNNEQRTTLDMLHALADGQLEARQREKILALLESSAELRGEMCDIYRVKDLVQTAYPLNEFQKNAATRVAFNRRAFAKVASYLLAFALTFATGYLVRDSGLLSGKIGANNNQYEYSNVQGSFLGNTTVQDNKAIVFLSSSEPEKFEAALQKAESLAKQYSQNNGKVYVVTSARGIDLLRLQTSPHKLRIKSLSNLYPSLHFVACNNSLYQFKQAGKSVELIDGAEVAPSAVEFVVKHLQQGWRYIAI